MSEPEHRTAIKIERAALALYGCVAGAYAILALLIPQRVAKAVLGHTLPAGGVLLHEMLGGMQLGLVLVALVLTRAPKPARTMVRAVALGLLCEVAGAAFATAMQGVPVPELKAYAPLLAFDLAVAIALGATQLLRRR